LVSEINYEAEINKQYKEEAQQETRKIVWKSLSIPLASMLNARKIRRSQGFSKQQL
jgi:hypothetical protein